MSIRDTDFTDDRLTIVLRKLSKPEYWHLIERDLSRRMVRVYDLSVKRVRVDATTISGYHSGEGEELFQLTFTTRWRIIQHSRQALREW